MELRFELQTPGGDPATLPERTYVLANSGGARKLSRCEPDASVHFSEPGTSCTVGIYQLLGQCRIDLDSGDMQGTCPVPSAGGGPDMQLRWSGSGTDRPETSAGSTVASPEKKHEEKKHEMKKYLNSQGVEELLAEAMRQLLKEQPANARQFLIDYLASTSGNGAAIPKEPAAISAEPKEEAQNPDELLVINGFYMSMRDCYTRPGAKIHYFDIEWDPAALSWHDFRLQFLGATDPTVAETGSLRSIINDTWRELGLHQAPSITNNGVHASASPFEAMAERANWLRIDVASDALSKALAAAGITLEVQMQWTEDPQVEWHRQNQSLFDLLEDLDSKELVQKASRLVQGTASDEALALCPSNRAFLFVKPHATVGDGAVEDLVRKKLAERGISVLSEGTIHNTAIEKDKLVDKHYGAIAAKASLLKPEETHPSQTAKEQFGMKFGMSWEEALSKGMVINALDMCRKLGIDGEELAARWNAAKDARKLIKFGGGFYCGQVSAALPKQSIQGELYVINGFYMAMRDLYTVAPASIHYFDVEWDRDQLTWSEFRQSILGATDPSVAAPGSLRNLVKEQWETLGLLAPPTIRENGVHASASPFEAMVERANWLEADLASEPLSQVLAAAGVPLSTQQEWATDAQVPFEGKNVSIFDLLEDLDTWPLLGRAARIAGHPAPADELKGSCPQNRAFVFVKPHAVVESGSVANLVRTKLESNGIVIKSEGSIAHQAIDEKKLIDKHYGAIAAKASLLQPSETNPTNQARDLFGMTFGKPWDQAVADSKVVNAVEACKLLGINGTQMAGLWDQAQKRGELIKFGGGFYCAKIV
eukprot:TRINITY_DN29180_c0_g1_i1.p1 TRINITY_DN29180_c0_g1~~TRINITY_DN29180_c0_g1_i1.p1  ORF type:complete len:832 (+),score=179.22 TRINITY_DN29180_c0_g1_i1:30-2498(+)